MMASSTSAEAFSEDRFDRLKRIEWWDQAKLNAARVLVIGAGALGNEILKNLALLGVGNVLVADIDMIERSNLSRSILYRESDTGHSKAEVAARMMKSIYPDICVGHFHGDVIYQLGLGVYRWADVVLAGLDNREARLHVNRCCYKVNRPWIDGATEAMQGVVRVFSPPDGPCYECTLTAADWAALKERRGCAGLRVEGVVDGRVPTTPVTASIIAALQTQEAIKLIHGLAGLSGSGMVFNGMINDAYVFRCHRGEECISHAPFEAVIPLNASVRSLTPRQLLGEAEARLGSGAAIEFTHELLISFDCSTCQRADRVLRPLATISERQAFCPDCGKLRRPNSVQSISGTEDFLDYTFSELGLAPFDVITARLDATVIGFECSADAREVLCQLPARTT